MKKTVNLLVLCCVLCGSLFAEMRRWRGADGKFFEGAYDKMLFGDVQVKDTKGRNHLIPFEKLAKDDLNYIQNFPPEIDIDLKKSIRRKPDMEWTISGDVSDMYTFTVRLKKTSSLVSKAKLTAELFVLCEELDGGNYILMRREASTFVFPEGKDAVHVFTTPEVRVREYLIWGELPDYRRGARYLGYILAVSDEKGNLIAHKKKLSRMTWLTDDLSSSLVGLRKIAHEGRGSSHARHFNERLKRTMTPRVKWHNRTNNF